MTIVAAADGSALGNPGPAGWAWYVDENCWRAGGWHHGTNNMGELMAVLDLFKSTAHLPEEPLHILCDSQYVINSVTKWMPGWKRKGWKKSDGKPVLNLDLLKEIDAALMGRKYTFEWVKGHAGHELNEAADDRARDAATAYQAKCAPNAGPGFPGAQAPGEQGPSAASAADGRASGQADFGRAYGQASSRPVAGQAASGRASAGQAASGRAAAGQAASGRAASGQAAAGQVAGLTPPAYGDQALFGEPGEPDLFSMLDDEADPSFDPEPANGIEAVVERERQLLDPEVRSDPFRLNELLHPDFEEIGASGQLWSRQEIIALLSEEATTRVDMEVMSLSPLGASTALLTYRSSSQGGSELRSSLWHEVNGQWRLRFHQGTRET